MYKITENYQKKSLENLGARVVRWFYRDSAARAIMGVLVICIFQKALHQQESINNSLLLLLLLHTEIPIEVRRRRRRRRKMSYTTAKISRKARYFAYSETTRGMSVPEILLLPTFDYDLISSYRFKTDLF